MPRAQHFKRFPLWGAILVLVGSGYGTPAHGEAAKPKYPAQILIIRHAEKTGEKDDFHLSQKGKERADLLDRLFAASKNRPSPFPVPDFIIAASNKQESHRPVETVKPLAMKLKVPIDERFTSKSPSKNDGKKPDMLKLRDELFAQPKYFGKTILISWRHSTIPELTKTLKADKAPAKWDDNVFDRVWQISYDRQGIASFRDFPQRLLGGDTVK
jgi:hypothetical protein